jgi:valyl-tRNA synthetase
MPFITEEIWNAVYDGKPPAKSIALMRYPVADQPLPTLASDPNIHEMGVVQAIVTAFRALRKDSGVPEKELIAGQLNPDQMRGMNAADVVAHHRDIFRHLAKISEVRLAPITYEKRRSEANFDLAIDYEVAIDVPAERERLTKDIARYEKGLAAAERQLGNEGFLAKAPAQIVEGLKKQEAETRLLLEKAHAALSALPKS